MNYYNEIKEQLIKSEIYDRAKDYSKDRHKVKVYYEIGRLFKVTVSELINNLPKRQLQERIRNYEYDRLSDETKTKLIESKELKVDDLFPNPIVIKSNSLKENLS